MMRDASDVADTSTSARLTLFGHFSLCLGEDTFTQFSYDKVKALLVYLLLHHQPVSRATLAELLWPDQGLSSGRTNLRRAPAACVSRWARRPERGAGGVAPDHRLPAAGARWQSRPPRSRQPLEGPRATCADPRGGAPALPAATWRRSQRSPAVPSTSAGWCRCATSGVSRVIPLRRERCSGATGAAAGWRCWSRWSTASPATAPSASAWCGPAVPEQGPAGPPRPRAVQRLTCSCWRSPGQQPEAGFLLQLARYWSDAPGRGAHRSAPVRGPLAHPGGGQLAAARGRDRAASALGDGHSPAARRADLSARAATSRACLMLQFDLMRWLEEQCHHLGGFWLPGATGGLGLACFGHPRPGAPAGRAGGTLRALSAHAARGVGAPLDGGGRAAAAWRLAAGSGQRPRGPPRLSAAWSTRWARSPRAPWI